MFFFQRQKPKLMLSKSWLKYFLFAIVVFFIFSLSTVFFISSSLDRNVPRGHRNNIHKSTKPPRQRINNLVSEIVTEVKSFSPILNLNVEAQDQNDPLSKLSSNDERKEAVIEAFKLCYESYERYCFGHDELRPLSKRAHDIYGNMGVTIVDSLDTMLLMGLDKHFKRARNWIEKNLKWDKSVTVSVFETNIRYLGGLLSAFDLTKDKLFLDKAEELAIKLLPAFNTQTGIPRPRINLYSGLASFHDWAGSSSILSEIGTMQMEFAYLSHHTNKSIYAEKVFKVIQILKQNSPPDGLLPVFISPDSGQFTRRTITVGALGDSFYEYLLKTWLLVGKKIPDLAHMYYLAGDSIINRLSIRTTPNNLRYIGEDIGGSVKHKMDHLLCFAGGMFALGAQHSDDKKTRILHMDMAKDLTLFCREMYKRQLTGLAPEYVNGASDRDFVPGQSDYLLRPETLESYFVLYRLTNNSMYRDWGWDIFKALYKYCKTDNGYCGIKNVNSERPPKDDVQQSWFLAETLKYLFLLFSDRDVIPLDKYVLNTEAHPLSIFNSNFDTINLL